MKTMYELLMVFSHGTTPCENHLINKYGEKLFIEALEKDYIFPCGENSEGETIYSITDDGEKKRDG